MPSEEFQRIPTTLGNRFAAPVPTAGIHRLPQNTSKTGHPVSSHNADRPVKIPIPGKPRSKGGKTGLEKI